MIFLSGLALFLIAIFLNILMNGAGIIDMYGRCFNRYDLLWIIPAWTGILAMVFSVLRAIWLYLP